MLHRLVLEGFKGFKHAELPLGPLTVLVGANASGKSNIREAFRFLHGIARGYTLAEIIGEKWGEGGIPLWAGIRGGIREISFQQCGHFSITVTMSGRRPEPMIPRPAMIEYSIEVDVSDPRMGPRLLSERILRDGVLQLEATRNNGEPEHADRRNITVRAREGGRQTLEVFPEKSRDVSPLLREWIETKPNLEGTRTAMVVLLNLLSMQFPDFDPGAMRRPSTPGQTTMGDRGDNLSSVLQAICDSSDHRIAAEEWIRELTPMDVADFEFPSDQAGRILVSLVEAGGQRISAYSASDGTLRFLAMLAAFLGPDRPFFYFFEELENGIHPNRLYLLLQLIEQHVGRNGIQVVATSHSPQLLASLSESARRDAVLVYRLPGQPDARIRKIHDIPEAARVLETQDLARLHAAGWLEDAVELTDDEVASA